MSLISTLDFVLEKAKLQPNEFGENDIIISMVGVYKDGKFLKHAKLNEELLKALAKKGSVKVEVSTSDLQGMTDKNPHLATLVKTLDLEQVPTDQDIIDWFKTNEVPLVAIQGKHYVIERPDDFVKSHLMYVEKFGTNSKTGKTYMSRLKDLYDILQK